MFLSFSARSLRRWQGKSARIRTHPDAPERWLAAVDTESDLTMGRWEVVLLRYNCAKCETFARSLPPPADGWHRILVEMEPYADDPNLVMSWTSADAHGRIPLDGGVPIDAAPRLFTVSDSALVTANRPAGTSLIE